MPPGRNRRVRHGAVRGSGRIKFEIRMSQINAVSNFGHSSLIRHSSFEFRISISRKVQTSKLVDPIWQTLP